MSESWLFRSSGGVCESRYFSNRRTCRPERSTAPLASRRADTRVRFASRASPQRTRARASRCDASSSRGAGAISILEKCFFLARSAEARRGVRRSTTGRARDARSPVPTRSRLSRRRALDVLCSPADPFNPASLRPLAEVDYRVPSRKSLAPSLNAQRRPCTASAPRRSARSPLARALALLPRERPALPYAPSPSLPVARALSSARTRQRRRIRRRGGRGRPPRPLVLEEPSLDEVEPAPREELEAALAAEAADARP